VTDDDPPPALAADAPYLTAGAGDIDITGHRRPASYYREIVFGLRSQPYIAVQRPQHFGKTWAGTPWAWTDSIASWTWPGYEGAPVIVEVYSNADEVELLIGGLSLGRSPVGEKARFRAEFETTYQPGEVVAIAYAEGTQTGRHVLRSAEGPLVLRAEADRSSVTADESDLAFVEITLTDEQGNLNSGADRHVKVVVSGPGHLQGFGSADPMVSDPFTGASAATYDGRALAVIRPTGPGEISVTVSAAECPPRTLLVIAQ
jgi:beta-galactosidase